MPSSSTLSRTLLGARIFPARLMNAWALLPGADRRLWVEGVLPTGGDQVILHVLVVGQEVLERSELSRSSGRGPSPTQLDVGDKQPLVARREEADREKRHGGKAPGEDQDGQHSDREPVPQTPAQAPACRAGPRSPCRSRPPRKRLRAARTSSKTTPRMQQRAGHGRRREQDRRAQCPAPPRRPPQSGEARRARRPRTPAARRARAKPTAAATANTTTPPGSGPTRDEPPFVA